MSLDTEMTSTSQLLDPRKHSVEAFRHSGGGKASQLASLVSFGIRVPDFICLPKAIFEEFKKINHVDQQLSGLKKLEEISRRAEEIFLSGELPKYFHQSLSTLFASRLWTEEWLAVRSSGLDEDGAQHSFAGQYSSFLFQRGMSAVEESIRRCWASAYSVRVLSYRLENGLSNTNSTMGVIIQKMVNCEASGVAFSRNPIHPLDQTNLVIESVWGLGEGLVSGELDADHFEVDRSSREIHVRETPTKLIALVRGDQGGLSRMTISPQKQMQSSLTDGQITEVAQLCLDLEKLLGVPQDCEWGFEGGNLYCLQTRPITTLPPSGYYSPTINGTTAVLWDNSNIIESYSGVTSPLTFSFASSAYRQVYIQFCQILGVPERIVRSREAMFRNMLGLIRGRIYYNLANWYRLVLMLPGASNNKQFMETMMGVKQGLRPDVAASFDFDSEPLQYRLHQRVRLLAGTVYRWWRIDSIIADFKKHFNFHYQRTRAMNFKQMPLTEHAKIYQQLDEELLRRWHAPIINDYLCMIFFGLLKKMTEKWLPGPDSASLQNDLLCGEGDLESTEPTKMLMRIADWIDNSPGMESLKSNLLSEAPAEMLRRVMNSPSEYPKLRERLVEFLDKYGFRCINELKLEENDLHDDPGFLIEALRAYLRRKSYSISKMEERERAIRSKAESVVRSRLGGFRLMIYNWVLKEARRAVKNRENLRFDRTKIFGVVRHLFRGVGHQLHLMGKIRSPGDIFYLTADEIIAWIEGRNVTQDLESIVSIRRLESEQFLRSSPPPDRFFTQGSVGFSSQFVNVLLDADLLKNDRKTSDDPSILMGTPCCPGVIEGVVRVVKQASDAEGLDGEILVTERTDPGWVPLYPSCSGLLIERGSLLSHSAVVARELGLPTIVGISGGLLKKLKSGMRVRVDAGKGEVRILAEEAL